MIIMVFKGIELVLPVAVVVTIVVLPVVSPVLRDWLLMLLVVLNMLLVIILVLAMCSPQVSLSLLTSLCETVQAPLLHLLDTYGHLPQDLPPPLEGLALHMGSPGTQMAEDEGQSSCDRIWWLRQLLFIFTLIICQPYPGILISLTRFTVWWVGVRTLVSLLASGLTVLAGQKHELVFPLLFPHVADFGGMGRDFSSLLSPLVYLVHVIMGAFALSHCVKVVSAWELLGLLLFSVCSDHRVQKSFKVQAQKFQVDFLEGFEGEMMHGLLIFVDMMVCMGFFTRAVYQGQHFVLLLSYSSGFLALLELWYQVVQKVRVGLHPVSDVPRASRQQLREYNDVCAVCLCPMSAARITGCRHLFHGKCLRQALGVSPHCPLCKKHLVSQGVYFMLP